MLAALRGDLLSGWKMDRVAALREDATRTARQTCSGAEMMDPSVQRTMFIGLPTGIAARFRCPAA